MTQKCHRFEDVKGHPQISRYFKEHIESGTLPHFIIMDGEEGLGKTSFAKLIAIALVHGFGESEAKAKDIRDVIDNKRSTDNIKYFTMAVDGGKVAAKEVLAEFNTKLVKGNKVIIMDECHQISDEAQDIFLVDTEFLPKNLYVIMLTTEITRLKMQLRSRAVPIHLHRLKQSDMLKLLSEEVERRGLVIQGGEATLSLIVGWAECKPRTALTLLNAFADNERVSANTIKGLIGYLEVSDVLPLVKALTGSMSFGLEYIQQLNLSESLLDILVEVLKIKCDSPSYKLRVSEIRETRDAIEDVPIDTLTQFVYKVADSPITKKSLIAAFLNAHINSQELNNPDSVQALLKDELMQKSMTETPPNVPLLGCGIERKAPSIDSLMMNSSVIRKDG